MTYAELCVWIKLAISPAGRQAAYVWNLLTPPRLSAVPEKTNFCQNLNLLNGDQSIAAVLFGAVKVTICKCFRAYENDCRLRVDYRK